MAYVKTRKACTNCGKGTNKSRPLCTRCESQQKKVRGDCPQCGRGTNKGLAICSRCQKANGTYQRPSPLVGPGLRYLKAYERANRALPIVRRVRQGMTLEQIGQEDGLSRERVRQLLVRAGYRVADLRPRRQRPKPWRGSPEWHALRLNKLREKIEACQAGGGKCWGWTGPSAQAPGCREGYRVPKCRGPRYSLDQSDWGDTQPYRASWIFANGPIPAGMTVDHICFNPMCVNPAHLQLLTRSENSARKSPRGIESARQNIAKAHEALRAKRLAA